MCPIRGEILDICEISFSDTCNWSMWVLGSSLVSGSHHFWQKIIKNALVGLVIFFLNLSKSYPIASLLILLDLDLLNFPHSSKFLILDPWNPNPIHPMTTISISLNNHINVVSCHIKLPIAIIAGSNRRIFFFFFIFSWLFLFLTHRIQTPWILETFFSYTWIYILQWWFKCQILL